MIRWFSGFSLILLVGCLQQSPDSGSTKVPPIDKQKFLLTSEPAGARDVIAVQKEAKDGDEVVVVGRIGGGGKTGFISGRLSFRIVDLSLEPCDDDGCGNPYCAFDKKQMAAATTLVKFVDASGETLPHDAAKALGLKDLQTVVVRGRVRRDTQERVTILASGVYPRLVEVKP